MKIVFNADDFGLSEGVNNGIIAAYQNGVVKSTTLMANGLAFDHAVALAHANPGLSVGIHLVATYGHSFVSVNTNLVDANNRFKRDQFESALFTNTEDLFDEWCAQIDFVSKHISITHFDSHHHTHMHPSLKDVVARIHQKYGLPYRSDAALEKTSFKLDGNFYKEALSLDTIRAIIDNNTEDLDVMTHPGFVDETLLNTSSYTTHREHEHSLLTSKALKDLLNEKEIEICSYESI